MAELAVINDFDLQTMSGNLADAVAEEMDGLGALPFDKVKIPTGGNIAFTLTKENGEPDVAAELTGIILHHHPVNSYWQNKFTGSNEQPDCVSLDGKQGIEKATGKIVDCEDCLRNKFGSDGGGGKACKNTRRIFFLREGSPIPVIITLPPTSIKYMRDYIGKNIILKGRRCWQVVTKITLAAEKNKGGIPYSHAVFTLVGVLGPEKAAEAEAMHRLIIGQCRQEEAGDAYQEEEAEANADGFVDAPEGDAPFQGGE